MEKVMFIDGQVGGYSSHNSIEGMFEMLLYDWLDVVSSCEEYEGELEFEKEKWNKASEEMKREFIKGWEFEIVDSPTKEDILQWEEQHNRDWS